jgi:branched-chain amino acid transport system substrate-binding protein
MLRRSFLAASGGLPFALARGVAAQGAAPNEIKIGEVYSGSGTYAAISLPVYNGMKLWADRLNADGGVFVKPYGRKIKIRLVGYDDQSQPATSTTMINQLITQDKVDILVANSGSVLAAAAMPVARDNKMLLFNPTGSGLSLFSADNPYMVLTSTPFSAEWPKWVAQFLAKEGPANGIKRVALIYATNEFTSTLANAFRSMIKASGAPLEFVYDQGVPTATSNYTVLINNIAAAKPDAVIALGYPNNDIAFLRNLGDSGVTFRWRFQVYPGIEPDELAKSVGYAPMEGLFSFATAIDIDYKPDVGMPIGEYRAAWDKAYPEGRVEFGFNAIAGYNTGLVIERTLATADSMAQLELRRAAFALSGKMRTLNGPFELNAMGAQIGSITPAGQLVSDGHGKLKMNVVWPPEVATAKAIYGAP